MSVSGIFSAVVGDPRHGNTSGSEKVGGCWTVGIRVGCNIFVYLL